MSISEQYHKASYVSYNNIVTDAMLIYSVRRREYLRTKSLGGVRYMLGHREA